MKTFTFLSLIATLFISLFCNLSFANMQIFPVRAHITPENNTTTLTLRNKEGVRNKYVINAVYFEQTGDGKLDIQDDEKKQDRSALKIIKFSPRTFSLDPDGEQVIRIMAKNDKRLEPGDYRVHMRFTTEEAPENDQETQNKNVAFKLKAKIAISIPVLYRIESFEKKVDLKNFKLNTQNKSISFELIRTAKNYFPYGKVEVYVKKGDKKISITEVQGVQCFGDKLNYTFNYENIPSKVSPGDEITLEYIDTFADKEVSIAKTSTKL